MSNSASTATRTLRRYGRVILRSGRTARRAARKLRPQLSWGFGQAVARMILEYRLYSTVIVAVTILQEFAALWRVDLLGRFIDRLGGGALGDVVWLFLAASLLRPGLVRANVILRRKMLYETDFKKRVELVLQVAEEGSDGSSEAAGTAYQRAVNAVNGIIKTVYHVLGSFTPVIIKIVMVAGSLLSYNRLLGEIYLASLVVPVTMTVLFNRHLEGLRDSKYSVTSEASGMGIRAISEEDSPKARRDFQDVMQARKGILVALAAKSHCFRYARRAALIGSQFLVVLLALSMRTRIDITPGGFAKLIGYTTQVANAFTTAVARLDSIVSFSRAYHVFADARGGDDDTP